MRYFRALQEGKSQLSLWIIHRLAMVLLAVCMLSRAWAQAPSEVVIAAEDDWAPYSYVGPSNADPRGFAVSLVREAFASQSIRVRFITVPFARCMFLAKIGKVAGCFDATILDDNRSVYVWNETPMFREQLAIFARANTTQTNMTLKDLEGKRVGYTIEYTYPDEFSLNPRVLKFGAKNDRVLLEMLLAGHLDYIIINTTPAYVQMRKMGKSTALFAKVGVIAEDGFWVAFTRANPSGAELAAKFERGLKTLHQTGRYQELREQLMPEGLKQGPER